MLGAEGAATAARGRWWAAGVEDCLAARIVPPVRAGRYDVAPSPRSTRGATRA